MKTYKLEEKLFITSLGYWEKRYILLLKNIITFVVKVTATGLTLLLFCSAPIQLVFHLGFDIHSF